MSKNEAFKYFENVIKARNIEGLRAGIARAKELGIWDVETVIVSTGGSHKLIHTAAKHSLEALKILRAEGANIDSIDSHGDTPIIAAARVGRFDEASWILNNGGNTEIKNSGKDFFDIAIESDKPGAEAFTLSIVGGVYNPKADEIIPDIRKAFAANKVKLAAAMIQRSNISFSPEEEGGVFRAAVEKLFTPGIGFPITVIREMFKKYIDVKSEQAGDNQGFWQTVRDIAEHNNEGLQAKILSEVVRIENVIRDGYSLVTFAAIFNNEAAFYNREITMPLIEWSADHIGYRDVLGHTPAEWATRNEDTSMLDALVEMGAEVPDIAELDASWMQEAKEAGPEAGAAGAAGGAGAPVSNLVGGSGASADGRSHLMTALETATAAPSVAHSTAAESTMQIIEEVETDLPLDASWMIETASRDEHAVGVLGASDGKDSEIDEEDRVSAHSDSAVISVAAPIDEAPRTNTNQSVEGGATAGAAAPAVAVMGSAPAAHLGYQYAENAAGSDAGAGDALLGEPSGAEATQSSCCCCPWFT